MTEARPAHTKWLGSVPPGWEVTPLKFVATVFPSNVDKHSRADEVPVALCNYTDVYYNDVISLDIDFMKATATEEQIKKFRLRAGDTIITKDSESADDIGLSAYVPNDFSGVVCGYHLSMIRPGNRVVGRFIKRLFDSHYVKAILETSANGLTRVGLGQYALDNIDIPLPPVSVQEAIADFLDRETAKIDALIDKQEKLIATLREDRAATITQAVTKGLDPNVEMRDSGIERLGRIPAHWTVPQLGWHTRIGNGSTPARDNQTYWESGAIPWLNSAHVNRDRITDADQFVTDTAMLECHLPMVPACSVLVGLTGQGKTRGMGSLLTVPSTINQHLAYVTPTTRHLSAEYLLYAIRSAYDHLRETSEENGSTKGGLTCDALKRLRVPLPPLGEQCGIEVFLEARCAKIDALVDKSTEMIETLREYRSALITNAVTGKIDVREAV